MSEAVILQMQHISKSFPGVRVLNDVSLQIRKGSVHALLGENGAGKSTLMKILQGIYTADSGQIIFDGEPLRAYSIHHALCAGISMISQELSPILTMSVAENIYLGREPRIGATHFVDDKKLISDTAALFEKYGVEGISPRKKMRELSIAQIQMVEICKAISYRSKLIIMDEPTSSLARKEIESLFRMIRALKKDGTAFIFISHKLDEVFDISDDITILRDGSAVCSCPSGELTQERVIEHMVGREITHVYPKAEAKIAEAYFEVEHLNVPGVVKDVSFTVRRGEILGFCGLIGAGRTETMEALFGYRRKQSGTVRIDGRTVEIHKPADAIRSGMAFVTEDRKQTGLFLPLDAADNILMPSLRQYSAGGLIRNAAFAADSDELISRLNVKTPSRRQIVDYLSGGNQQKLLLARWMHRQPEVIILDEPTRGIDVGAKAEIYEMIGRMAQEGRCIIVISSELPEVMGISDTIAVMHDGRLVKTVARADFDSNVLMQYATGLNS